MPDNSIYYRRNLPHLHPDAYPIFFTFNLTNSLPAEIVKELKARREQDLKAAKNKNEQYNIHERYLGQYDAWLHRCEQGPNWLASENVAQIVADEIHRMENERYFLMA